MYSILLYIFFVQRDNEKDIIISTNLHLLYNYFRTIRSYYIFSLSIAKRLSKRHNCRVFIDHSYLSHNCTITSHCKLSDPTSPNKNKHRRAEPIRFRSWNPIDPRVVNFATGCEMTGYRSAEWRGTIASRVAQRLLRSASRLGD